MSRSDEGTTVLRRKPASAAEPTTAQVLRHLRQSIESEHPAAIRRLKIGIAIQGLILVLVIGYMIWLGGALSQLDADTLTSVASDKVEAMIPELRVEIRDYAIAMAPEVTDRAQAMLLDLPRVLGQKLEESLVARTDLLIQDFERDLDASLTDILNNQIALVKSQHPDATAEEAVDAAIRGVSRLYREKMMSAVDAMYDDYAREIGKLDDYFHRLQRADDLTETEKIDKEMIEAWVVLVQKHKFVRPDTTWEF